MPHHASDLPGLGGWSGVMRTAGARLARMSAVPVSLATALRDAAARIPAVPVSLASALRMLRGIPTPAGRIPRVIGADDFTPRAVTATPRSSSTPKGSWPVGPPQGRMAAPRRPPTVDRTHQPSSCRAPCSDAPRGLPAGRILLDGDETAALRGEWLAESVTRRAPIVSRGLGAPARAGPGIGTCQSEHLRAARCIGGRKGAEGRTFSQTGADTARPQRLRSGGHRV